MEAPFGNSIPDGIPLAYLITFRTYGTWLPGDVRGTADDTHNETDTPMIPPIPGREREARRRMSEPPLILDPRQRPLVDQTIRDVSDFRGWKVWELSVRTNHVHVVVSANSSPEPIMNTWKSWATRRLREAGLVHRDHIWARHGSTRYLWNQAALEGAIRYVREMQDLPNSGLPEPRP